MNEENARRVSAACDRLRSAGYGMLAHAVWVWWRNVADQGYINNVLDVERDIDRLLAAPVTARADLKELRMRVEEADALATKDEDADGWITAYHFNTGAWHRLLAEVRK